MNVIHQDLILMFKYIILEEIICDYWFSKNRLAIHERLKELITILISVVRSHSLDFDTKLGFDLEIEPCEGINGFILGGYSFNPHIAGKIIREGDKIAALILWDRKRTTNVRMNKIKKLLWLNPSLSEYPRFHLLSLDTGLADWLQLLFYLHELVKSDFQSYLLNILDVINIEII